METIVLISLITVIVAILLFIDVSKHLEIEKLRTSSDKMSSCYKFSNEVASVYILGNGTVSSIKIDYNITFGNGTAFIDSVSCKICCNLTKNNSAVFNVSNGFVTVQNRNGDVIV